MMPGKASLTITVPEAVPSVFHSSMPCGPSLAAQKTVLPTTVRLRGCELRAPDLMSEIITVPLPVPSLS